jgi:HEAT repeat protein
VRTAADLRQLAADITAPVSKRQTAEWLLGVLPDPDAEAAEHALLVAARDDDARVRATAMTSLGYLGRLTSVERLSKALLKDPDAWVRETAANALAEIGATASVDALVASLTNPQEVAPVRGEAAKALGATGSSRAFAPLMGALDDPHPEVRFFAAYALGELGDQRAIKALDLLATTDHAQVSTFGTVADAAAEAIQTIHDKG